MDFVIIGQGLAGTFLSYYLHKAGKTVLVIDEGNPYSSSKVASGVINPVTGRRLVTTWMIDEIMPFAVNAYHQFEKELNVKLIRQCNVLDFHPTPQMQISFDDRLKENAQYLQHPTNTEQWRKYFNYPLSVGEINPCYVVDLKTLLAEWRTVLKNNNQLIEERIVVEEVVKKYNQSTIIFCDGINSAKNTYFNLLPFAPNKGEALIVEINNLPSTNIFKQGTAIVPYANNLFWVGSSYEWNYTNANPSVLFKQKTEIQLNNWLKLPYKIINHIAAERPANLERRPFVGLHPIHKNIGILNGLGTKGCTLAPYFANEFTENLVNGKPINPLADVNRFTKILSK
ncbi:MAG: FAD-binding oxidoreductase [Bacteroidetes bacterium]|nr:FAD-binding oxidoreductase [Bacteroidota bacterium]MBS1592066.1 FAD-binding oxidoreductase [Bacteroidota bacterium]